jgi:hypothetical protein
MLALLGYLSHGLDASPAEASYAEYSTAFSTASSVSGLGSAVTAILVVIVGIAVIYTASRFIKRCLSSR